MLRKPRDLPVFTKETIEDIKNQNARKVNKHVTLPVTTSMQRTVYSSSAIT